MEPEVIHTLSENPRNRPWSAQEAPKDSKDPQSRPHGSPKDPDKPPRQAAKAPRVFQRNPKDSEKGPQGPPPNIPPQKLLEKCPASCPRNCWIVSRILSQELLGNLRSSQFQLFPSPQFTGNNTQCSVPGITRKIPSIPSWGLLEKTCPACRPRNYWKIASIPSQDSVERKAPHSVLELCASTLFAKQYALTLFAIQYADSFSMDFYNFLLSPNDFSTIQTSANTNQYKHSTNCFKLLPNPQFT